MQKFYDLNSNKKNKHFSTEQSKICYASLCHRHGGSMWASTPTNCMYNHGKNPQIHGHTNINTQKDQLTSKLASWFFLKFQLKEIVLFVEDGFSDVNVAFHNHACSSVNTNACNFGFAVNNFCCNFNWNYACWVTNLQCVGIFACFI